MLETSHRNEVKGSVGDAVERREVRATYRELAKTIDENAIELTNPASTVLSEYLDQAEKLFSKVRHPREAVQDSNFLVQLTKRGREQTQQLKTDMVSFDDHIFAEKVIKYVNGRHDIKEDADLNDSFVDLSKSCWVKLAKRASPLFKKTPSFDFLLGPLVIEAAPPKQIKRSSQTKIPEGKTVKLKQIDTVEQQEEATTREVERIYQILKEETNQGQTDTCLFQFVINPNSFGQTVENLFHLSFLVKDDRVSVELDEYQLPRLNLHKGFNEKDQNAMILRKQVVCPLTMENWKELIQVYDIAESRIPTRKKLFGI